MSSIDVLLTNDDLIVLGGPQELNIELDYGPKGDRGSFIFVGDGEPDNAAIYHDSGKTVQPYDFYINVLRSDPNNGFLMFYCYRPGAEGTTLQWEPVTKLIPNTYSETNLINFSVQNFCEIPIPKILDPSYSGNVDASNFSVNVTFSTSDSFPIASSIKTEIVQATGVSPAKLKITFYAKEFDTTIENQEWKWNSETSQHDLVTSYGKWVDVSGTRTAHIHISVV